jgi:hypothetical protein
MSNHAAAPPEDERVIPKRGSGCMSCYQTKANLAFKVMSSTKRATQW